MSSTFRGVFLSYASEDVEVAAQIAAALTAADIEVWFDRSELRGGDAWDRKIRDQIRDCALFIPIISTATEARLEGYFRREWKLAAERTHDMADGVAFLLPMLLGTVPERQVHVPDAFRSVQWTRLENGVLPRGFADNVAHLLQPQGPSQSRDVPRSSAGPVVASQSVGPKASRPRVLWITAGLVAIAGLAIFAARAGRNLPPPAMTAAPAAPAIAGSKSIAVLPFVDMSEAKDKEYFSDGLSEELIDLLSRSPDLRVISRTSSFQFKGKNDDARLIGERLGVTNLLEGSVRASGQSVRITAQLIRASDGSHLWSRTYDRQLSDLFALQDEIAGMVVGALQATLSGHGASLGEETKNPAAHDLLLKGNYFYLRAHPGDLKRAVEQFKAALELDPSYALAWVKLARAYIWEQVSPESSAAEHEQNARDALQRALAIDPNLAVAHRWMGRLYMNFRWDWPAAQREFRRVMALDPDSADAKDAQGDLAAMQGFIAGNLDEAIFYGRRSVEADVLDTSAWYFLCWALRMGHHLQQSADACRRLLDLDADVEYGRSQSAFLALQMNDPDRALELATKEGDKESRLQALAVVHWRLGQHEASDSALHDLVGEFAKLNPFDIAAVYAYRGELDEAFKWLEQAFAQRDGTLILVRVDPLFDRARSDPRYTSLLTRMNMQP